MEKINDMLLATLANPQAKTLDFLNNDVLAENTQMLSRDEYKTKKSIQDKFTTDGKFDEDLFNQAYDKALYNYNTISNEEFIKKINQAEYSPFDTTRPLTAKTYNIDVLYSPDFNPMRNLYSRDGINLISPSKYSQRELAQATDVFDPKTQSWVGKSANELGLIDKFFGDTLVYASWDDDGVHVDPISKRTVKHKKGDWKINDSGDFFVEKLAGREIYGKQIVNPTDILTTDGSVFNKFDFFDADGREKSLASTALRTIVEIAPFLIPGVALPYGGLKAAIGLSAVLPTFYKSIENLLMGDNKSFLTDPATEMEGYMAKFVQRSTSDKASESFFNSEQILSMVSDIFSQIHEQRAMASLSTLLYRPDKLMNRKAMEIQMNATLEAQMLAKQFGTSVDDIMPNILQNLPEMKQMYKRQSQLSKALSLGYMALTSSADVYGSAIQGGYDRRTAGFASLLAASGQYGVMMNNKMGDWFLDKTTGYNLETNRALMSKSLRPYLDEIKEIFSAQGISNEIKRNRLAAVAVASKKAMRNLFTGASVAGEAMWKNALVEGAEEVTEEVMMDLSMAIVDVMSYLGLTKERGSFDTLERFADGSAFQNYLANFVGGLLGGTMFEFENKVMTPWIENKGVITPPTMQSLYELIADGKKNDVIAEIKKYAKDFTNHTLSYMSEEGNYLPADKNILSQQQLIESKAIEIVNNLDRIINSEGLGLSDEDIIAKAVRQKVIIDRLNASKIDGKYTGIEALVIHDFKNTGLKVDKIKAKIAELQKLPDMDKQITLEKEKMMPLVTKINSILSGERSSDYFTKTLFALSPNINKFFGTLDIDTFTKAKYGKSYSELPDKNSSISKETVTEEWNNFLDSTDIYEKLSVMTDSYLEVERKTNPILQEYKNSGYLEARKQVYDTLINMVATLKHFDTSSDSEKSQKISNFIELNNKLEKEGLTKVLPWDALNLNLYDKLKENNLLRKITYTKDKDWNWVTNISDSSSNEELFKTVLGNIITQGFSPDFLRTEHIIQAYNSALEQHNDNILKQIDNTKNSDEITQLEKQLIDTVILDFTSTEKYKNIIEKFNKNVEDLKRSFNISEDQAKAFQFVKENEGLYKTLLTALEINETTNDYDVNSDQAKEIFRTIAENGLLALTTLSEEDLNLYNSIILKLNTDENLTPEEISLAIKVNNIISEKQNEGLELLSNEFLESYSDAVKSLEDVLVKNIEKQRTDFLNIKNLAFDQIMNVLETGINDNELFKEVKETYDNSLTSLKKSVFKNDTEISDDDFIHLVKNINELSPIISSFASSSETFNNIDMNDILEMLEYLSKFKIGEDQGNELDNYLETITSESEELKELKKDDLVELYNEINIGGFEINPENVKLLSTLVDATDSRNDNYSNVANILSNKFSPIAFQNLDFKIADRFLEFINKDNKLLNNPIYEFLRKFSVTLDPTNRVSTILDILENEEVSYHAASGVSNFFSDDIREKDIKTAINVLEMIKAFTLAATSSEISGKDIVGFLGTRQDYARKTNTNLEVLDLQTLTSEEAYVITNDIDRIIIRLNFLKDLAESNSTRSASEHAEIGRKIDSFRINDWEYFVKVLNDSVIPKEVIDILNSTSNNFDKLRKIEDAVFEHNKNNPEEALKLFLSKLPNFWYNHYSNITKDVKESEITDYDKAIYITTVLSTHSTDFWKQRIKALEKSKKAPFYMQDYDARVILAKIKNPELFKSIGKYKLNYKDIKDPSKGLIENEKITVSLDLTTVLGSAGSGKTTAIMGTVLNILKQTNNNTNVWLVAPQDRQVNNMTKAVISETGVEGFTYSSFNKDKLFKELGLEELYIQLKEELVNSENKNNTLIKWFEGFPYFEIPEDLNINIDKLPNLMIIDEFTHFSNAEILLLNEISNRTGKVNIIMLGDPNQMGYQLKLKKENLTEFINFGFVGINTIAPPPLKITVRASNELRRYNNELYLTLLSNITSLYSQYKNSADAINAVDNYIKKLDTIKSLKYYLEDSEIKGTYITEGYNISDFNRIKKMITDKGRSFVILTENGELSEDFRQVLQDVGLYQNGMLNENITVKDGIKLLEDIDAGKIQGSEVDHIIFDADLISKFDKKRDQIRSLYTFDSRSRIGSMIIGKNYLNKGSNLEITNAEQANYPPIEYQPLTESVIETLKNEKLEELKASVGNDLTLSEKAFTWDNIDEISGTDDTKIGIGRGSVLNQSSSEVIDGVNKGLYSEEEIDALKNAVKPIKPEDFKIMIHSFYNNLGVEHELDSSGNLSKIIVDRSNPATDLNGPHSVTDAKSITQILNEWSKLKNDLLFNSVNKDNYKNYFKHIFTDDFNKYSDMLDKVDIKFKITAQRYNENINNPYKKHGYSVHLTDGELFLNLSAEINYTQDDQTKTHYVTVATFATLNTFKEAIKNYADESDVAALTKRAENKFEEITKALGDNNFIVLNDINPDQFSILTNTRFDQKKKNQSDVYQNLKHNLFSLQTQFPGMKYSEMRLFPSSKQAFKQLLERYTFGSDRSNETIDELYTKYKNKPYITVSYDNKLDGTTDKKAQARLVPVSSHKRSFDNVVKEVRELRKEIKESFSDTGNIEVSKRNEFNAKQEMLLGSPQILHVLAKWAVTPITDTNKTVIDLLTDKVGENSVIDILTKFKDSDNQTTKKLLEVITLVKEEAAKEKDPKKIVGKVIPKLDYKTGWTWNFFNLFDYNYILNTKKTSEKSELIKLNFTNDGDGIDNEIIEKLRDNVKTLFKELPVNFDWYYNIPIEKGEKGDIVVNKFVSGNNGFDNADVFNRFYISGSPESPRLLISLDQILGKITKPVITPKEKVEPEPEIKVEPEVEITSNPISSIESFEAIKISDGSIVHPLKGFTKTILEFPDVKIKLNDVIISDAVEILKTDNMSPMLKVSQFLHALTKNSESVGMEEFINTADFVNYFLGKRNRILKTFLDNIQNELNQCK